MQTENNSPVLDHLPSPAELAQMYAQQEKNDPRSLFYERAILRPKLPIGKMLLALVLTLGVCLVAGIFLGILGALGVLVVLGVLFAKPLLVLAVKCYQAIAPADLRKRCRYEPSCSAYMLLAVEKYGFWKGLGKGLRRWKGCKPPNGGYDMP